MTCPPSSPASDITVSLPLQGHYRSGRYMPVRIAGEVERAGVPLLLRGRGALTTELQSAGGHVDAVFPWLSIRTVSEMRYSTGGDDRTLALQLHALDEDERLIGYVGADPDALAGTFAGKTLVRVPLDVTDPLPGDATAWEALDGIVLDTGAARRIDNAQVRALLAGGAAIAIRSAQKPGGDWPWRREGAFWIAQLRIAGPSSAYFPDAYDVTPAWVRGWPPSFRRQVVGAAVVFMLIVTGAGLSPRRWRLGIVLVLSLVTAALAHLWRGRQSSAIDVSGNIIIQGSAATQADRWSYHAVLRASDASFPWQPPMHPVFGYRSQSEELDARLVCASDGTPASFRLHLNPRQILAFQTRTLRAGHEPLSPTQPISSPLRGMADKLYAASGDRLAGQILSDGDTEWPAVVVEQGSRSR